LATGGGSQDGMIHFWNTTTQGKINSINAGSQVTSIQWSIAYKEFVSSHGYPNNQLSVWSYPSLNKIADLPGHDARILSTALSPDGETVASSASDENLKFWRIFEREKGSKGSKDLSKKPGSSLDLEEDLLKSYSKLTIR
jgi:cell division cycle protein 20 (cofactor of APC complex)